jgi:hypothetical protein
VTSGAEPSRKHAILEGVFSSLRARTLLACLLMVATIDSAAGVCAFMCSHRSEPAGRRTAAAAHGCHEAANVPGPDGSLAAAPVRCAPERAALTGARLEAPAFKRAMLIHHVAAIMDVVSPLTRVHLVYSEQYPPPGAPPGAPLPLRI